METVSVGLAQTNAKFATGSATASICCKGHRAQISGSLRT